MMSRPNLRQKPRISYYEPEEPSLDEYIFCDQCSDFVYEYCALHGPLLVIPDDKVPSKTNFPSYVPRAALTIPHVFLHLAPSIIPGAGLGVFSTLTLPRGVRFGPYCGQRSQQVDSMYCWQIYDRNNKRSHVVDAADGERSNWMRYVNCARHWREQNLLAYQYKGQLYYRTIKIIPRFTELMVFYGSEFANILHINLSKYNSPPGYAQKFGAPGARKPKQDKENQNKYGTILNQNKQNHLIKKTGQADTKVQHISKAKSNKFKSSKKGKENCIDNPKIDVIPKIIDPKLEISKSPFDTSCNNNNNDFKCKSCNYIGINIEDVKRHDLSHSSLLNNDNLIKILQNNNNLKNQTYEKPYKCDICQRCFKHKNSLQSHIRIHTGENPYKCDICQKCFTNNSNLRIHIRIHTGENPYKCDICQKCFTNNSNLRIHIRIHSGEKPYKCDICQTCFKHKNSLQSHIRIHTGEKPYKCDICQKCFSNNSNLRIHIRIHSGEKPYKCDICQKCFTQKGELRIHIRIHTGEKPYKCDICQKCFSQKSSLNKHIRIHIGR